MNDAKRLTPVFSAMDQAKLNRAARWLALTGFAVFAAALFSWPFPFSRIPWFRPGLEVYGFLNAGLFLWAAHRVRKLSVTAAFAVLGIVLHETILNWSGFYFVSLKHSLTAFDRKFLLGATVFIFMLVLLIFRALRPLFAYTRTIPRKMYFSRRIVLYEQRASLLTEALFASAFFYVLIFAAMGLLPPHFSLRFQFSLCKALGMAACMLTMAGVGQEICFYLEEIQTRFICSVKIFTHLLVLIIFFMMLYQRIPLQQFAWSG